MAVSDGIAMFEKIAQNQDPQNKNQPRGMGPVVGTSGLSANNRKLYEVIQPKLLSKRRQQTNNSDDDKLEGFNKFSCRWKRSLKDQVMGNTSNDKYCVGSGNFCDNQNESLCTDGNINVENEIPPEYWKQAPNFVGDMNLRTCSDNSNYDFQLTQDQVQKRCNEEHNKHKNNTNGWIYNTEHEFELPVKGGRKVRSNKGKKRGPYRDRTRKSRFIVSVDSNGDRSVRNRKIRSNKGKKRGPYGPRTGKTRSGKIFRGGTDPSLLGPSNRKMLLTDTFGETELERKWREACFCHGENELDNAQCQNKTKNNDHAIAVRRVMTKDSTIESSTAPGGYIFDEDTHAKYWGEGSNDPASSNYPPNCKRIKKTMNETPYIISARAP